MKNPVETFKNQLDRIRDLLDQGDLLSFTPEEINALRERTRSLSQKAAAIESRFLTIGLLGGTGVGKSTIMNALAGSEIAATSDRRPHTDLVLVYRHVDSSQIVPRAIEEIPWRELMHRSEAMKHILLCDLPDFDSLMAEHRSRVLHFLEHLDILVWITSPEKYGDARFYEFLQLVPKAKQNFYFVLNKLDLFFKGNTPDQGYQQVESALKTFKKHLEENGAEDPVLYPLSAEEACGADSPAPWNQFPAFKREIFLQRDMKRIRAIKAANLDVETSRVVSTFDRERLNLEMIEKTLDNFMQELERQRPLWVETGQRAIELWLDNRLQQQFSGYQRNPSVLVGPGYVIAALLQSVPRKLPGGHSNPPDLASFVPPHQVALSFRRRLDWIKDGLQHRILFQNLPGSFIQHIGDVLDVERNYQDLEERFSHAVALHVAEPSPLALWGFKPRQVMTYLVLLVFFLFAIAGEAAWQEVFVEPGFRSIARLFVSAIHNLFTARGLAALVTYGLLNLFFAIRFYSRYRRALDVAARKRMEGLKIGLGTVWEEKLDAIVELINAVRVTVRSRISAISSLGTRDPRDS